MARFWTRKNEDREKEKETMQADDFLYCVTKAKEQKTVEKPKIENNI